MRLFNRGHLPKYHKFYLGDETFQGLTNKQKTLARNKSGGSFDKALYLLDEQIVWLDKKTGRTITVPAGYVSDGASGAIDVRSKSWWVHDWLCDGKGFDGSSESVSNWTASRILSNILHSEKRIFRSFYWRWSTFFLGGENLKQF